MSRLSEAEYRAFGKEVIPGFLYLACRYESDDLEFLKQHGITHILNVALECDPTPEVQEACKVLHIPVRESPLTDIRAHFDEAFAFIDEARKDEGGRVLVHCFEGRNRSASFVLGYLMITEKWLLGKAFHHAKAARDLVDPNLGYLKQLRDLELELFGNAQSSLPVDEQTCIDLMDLDLINAENVGMYTDLASVTYEGKLIKIRPAPLRPMRVELPNRGARHGAARTASGTRGSLATAAVGRTTAKASTSRGISTGRRSASPGSRAKK
eukprot:TRINITY_DN51028_c0_g1_i1.p1 TRINITY_DN51028_c0_g1~~TRINITY_DN51028_c0_g1_i1.p1  ORF type:complete len:268 (+),score=50.90 TRINITY_DN51028_c0_g1_i1:206-1009(+)